MNKFYTGIILVTLSHCALAKTPNSLCNGVLGSAFTTGNGSFINPYLICNSLQLARLGNESALLTKNFRLGADLNFTSSSYVMIGVSQNQPFSGGFDGDGYTISSITIPNNNVSVGLFPFITNAKIENLLVDGLRITGNTAQFNGGLSALCQNSTINNVQITNLSLSPQDYTGGLIGQATNCTISNVVVQGTLYQSFGTDASGGLIGLASDSDISSCAAHVNIIQVSTNAFGVSAVSALIGFSTNSRVRNCYADGKVDYSAATEIIPGFYPHQIGGLFGAVSGYVKYGYYVNTIDVPGAEEIGAIAGQGLTYPSPALFWDNQVVNITTSPIGTGQSTVTMKSAAFWTEQGFDTTVWRLVNGTYPKLLIEG